MGQIQHKVYFKRISLKFAESRRIRGILRGSKLQKRCVRILFGEIYSFDHPEYYSTCARAKTFTEHMAQKYYALEHTEPIFNKYNLLNLHNLYVIRSLVELLKI